MTWLIRDLENYSIRLRAPLPSQRVHVPNNLVLGIWVIASIVQVLAKYVISGYLTLKACSQTEPQISLQGFRGHIGYAYASEGCVFLDRHGDEKPYKMRQLCDPGIFPSN